MRKIISIVFSFRIPESSVIELEKLVPKFLISFSKEFCSLKSDQPGPLIKITPKMHFMLHYPDMIRKFGPLMFFSSLRFERKNKKIKDLIKNNKCFKDIPLTIMKKYRLGFDKMLKNNNILELPRQKINYSKIDVSYRKFIPKTSSILTANSIEINSIKLIVNNFYLINRFPIFAKIEKIFIINSSYYIICNLYKGVFNRKLFSFRLIDRKEKTLLNVKKLLDYKSYTQYIFLNNIYVQKLTIF